MKMATAQSAGKKKIPERQCLGCGEHKPKPELIRIVRSPDGSVSLDLTGKKSGRGAYVCGSMACLRKVRKNHRADSALGVTIPGEVWDEMENTLSQSK